MLYRLSYTLMLCIDRSRLYTNCAAEQRVILYQRPPNYKSRLPHFATA